MENHYDNSKTWQLLENPVTLDEFNKTVKIESYARWWGVQPLSHINEMIDVVGPTDISIKNESGNLDQVESVILNSSDGNVQRGCVFTRKSHSFTNILITVKTRSLGKFLLQIYGNIHKSATTLYL